MEKSEIVEALSGVWYLATAEDDQPHVRPLDRAAEVGGKLYFGTARNKRMYEQILQNPKVEVYALNEFGACRFMAEAYEEEDEGVAREAFEQMGKPYDEATSVAVRLEAVRRV